MFKLAIYTIFFLGVSWILPNLHASDVKRSSLCYVKLGITHPPEDSSDILPGFGMGTRFQKGHYGLDLSANLSSMVFINYASLKGTFLFYPQPEKRHQLYFGLGYGIGYHLSLVPMCGPFGNTSSEYRHITLEGVLGYEFRHSRHFKTFVQVEFSQPTLNFGRDKHRWDYKPGVALTGGFGF